MVGGDEVDAWFAGTMRFPGGTAAEFEAAIDRPPAHFLDVIGEDGVIHLPDPWHGRAPVVEVRRGERVERHEPEAVDPYRAELDDVSAAIRDGRRPLLGRADAVGQARAIEALLASADASGEPVRLAPA